MDDLTATYNSLGRAELQLGFDDESLILADLFKTDDLILGFYTEEGMRLALERYGVNDAFAGIGYDDIQIDAGPHPNGYFIEITSTGERLIHVVMDRASLDLTRIVDSDASMNPEVLYIHWVLLQNPHRKFSKERPPLPAQKFPGLGFGRMVFELLTNVARRLGLEGLVAIPMQFHNAYFYDIGFEYADPKIQGTFEAMIRDGIAFYQSYYGFPRVNAVCAATWAFQFELVQDERGDPVKWFTEPMVCPVSKSLHRYIGSEWFRLAVGQATESNRFTFPGEALFQKLDEAGIRPLDLDKFESWRSA